jgi:hypothetical protein
MSSQRTLSFVPRVSRHGVQALYTFTPFKLLKAQKGETYELILAETAHHQVANLRSWRSRSVKDEFYFNVPAGFTKKIVQPEELYPTVLAREQTERYVFEPPNHRWRWQYFPEYMEFSWKALRDAHYCAFGWVLLSSKEDECPLTRDCPTRKGTPCKYYFGPIAYSSLYNVYPLVRKKYEPPPEKRGNEPIAAVRYESTPLLTLTYVPNGSYLAFIDGVVFSPKQARIFRQPLLFLKEGLGFRISQAPAIQFEFNKETLRELILDRLNTRKTLARWIKLKQLLYLGTDEGESLVREGRGFDAFKRLDEAVTQVLLKGVGDSERIHTIVKAVNEVRVDDDLIDFASVLFVHSFTHLFLNWISARYGYGKGDFGYYLEHDKLQPVGLQKEGVRAFVFEAAVGGLGYLRSFAQDLGDETKNILSEFFGSENQGIQAILKFCEERSTQAVKNLAVELNLFRSSEQIINDLIDSILTAYTKTFSDPEIYPHVNSIRRAIVDTLPMAALTTEVRSLIDDLLEKGPHCWDGCQLCVMLERGCNFPPFDQPFLVTSRLTLHIIRLLKRMFDSPTQVFPLKSGVYKEFRRFVSAATHTIDLVSPWLSPEVVRVLIEEAEKKELNVRILTTTDLSNKVHEDSLTILRERSDLIKTRTRKPEQLHAKGMLVDGVMLLTGTFNFTYSGLQIKEENITVDFSLQGVTTFKRNFDSIWAESTPLE